MATVPTPHSFMTSEFVTATNLDSYYSALQFLLGTGTSPHPYVHAYQSSAQTLPAGSTTNVTLDAEVEDSDAMHVTTAGSNYFFTVVTPGLYHVVAQVTFPSTASGQDNCIVNKNGTQAIKGFVTNYTAAHPVVATGYIRCVANDTLALTAFSTSGGAMSAGSGFTFMQARWVRE